MKHFIRILVLAVSLLTGLMTVSGQTVQVLFTQKVPAMPATAINYLNDPFRLYVKYKLISACCFILSFQCLSISTLRRRPSGYCRRR